MYSVQALLDPVVICPYNKNHLIARSRIQKHIVKCEKNYPPDYKIMCPYDATHRIFKHELEEHVLSCPMRNVLQVGRHTEPRKRGATDLFQLYEISSTVDCKEDWDREISDSDSQITINDCDEHIDENSINDSGLSIKDLRAPRGFSEAMLIDGSEASCIDELESVVSAMGLGRGRAISRQDNLMKLIIAGRGRSVNSTQ